MNTHTHFDGTDPGCELCFQVIRTLNAEVERLTRERDEARKELAQYQGEGVDLFDVLATEKQRADKAEAATASATAECEKLAARTGELHRQAAAMRKVVDEAASTGCAGCDTGKNDCLSCRAMAVLLATDAGRALLERVARMEAVLTGGYEQGDNGLVVDRRKARAALAEDS